MSRDNGASVPDRAGGLRPEPAAQSQPIGAHPSRDITLIEGVAYVLPLYEGGVRFAKRVGPFGIGMNWRWSSFNIGIDILEGGALLAVGPFYFWIAHIERQGAAFKRLDRIAQGIEARSDETLQAAQPEGQESGPSGCAQNTPANPTKEDGAASS